MASLIWSRWWAELRASSRMSVNFNSFSLSSLFSCRMISASASVHSQILGKEMNTKLVVRGGQGIRKNKASLKGWTVILSSRYRNYLLLARPRQKRKSFTHSHTFTGSKLETVTTFSFNLSFIFSEVWKQSIILVYKVILKIPLLLIFMGPRNHCDITFHSAIFQET